MNQRQLEMELATLRAAYRRVTEDLVKTQFKLQRAEGIIDVLLAARGTPQPVQGEVA